MSKQVEHEPSQIIGLEENMVAGKPTLLFSSKQVIINLLRKMKKISISDMALVTTLSLEFSIVGLKKDAYDPRRIWFEFEDTDDLQKTVSDFWSGKVKVEPQKLFNQLKMIKTRIYNL